MTTFGIVAIAAEREIGCVRECGEGVEEVAHVGALHLGMEAFGETRPRSLRITRACGLHQFLTRREIRKPDVIPVIFSEAVSGNATWRAAYSSEAHSFARQSG